MSRRVSCALSIAHNNTAHVDQVEEVLAGTEARVTNMRQDLQCEKLINSLVDSDRPGRILPVNDSGQLWQLRSILPLSFQHVATQEHIEDLRYRKHTDMTMHQSIYADVSRNAIQPVGSQHVL